MPSVLLIGTKPNYPPKIKAAVMVAFLNFINMIWKYIKTDSFFNHYVPHIKNYKHKLRGKNGRGNPLEFTDSEKKEIKKALEKMISEVKGI